MHPVTRLRAEVADQFVTDLPPGVHPVEQWCADPQFFPGATGLLSDQSWPDVKPGSVGVSAELLPAPLGGVLVLGNYQASRASYRRVLDGQIGGFPWTWRVLRQLLASTLPSEVFLTNAFIGLPDLDSDTAPFPTTPSFIGRCERLLRMEIRLFRPRVVVCLGVPAARLLADVVPDLTPWRPWPGYNELDRRMARTVDGCKVGGVDFTSLAVHHPSAVVASRERQRDAGLIAIAARRCGFS